MDFCPAYLKRALLTVFMVFAAVFCAHAQHSAHLQGQPIFFSSPESENVTSNLPSLLPRLAEQPDFANTLPTPSSFDFNPPPADDTPQFDVPVLLTDEGRRLQGVLDPKKNWIMMTPGEIFGVTTPEKIMGIPERDAIGRRKNQTALERYNERQSQILSSNANAYRTTYESASWNHLSDPLRGHSETFNSVYVDYWNMANKSDLPFNSSHDNQTLTGSNLWSKALVSPSPSLFPNEAQQTDIDRLKQLFGLGSASATSPLPSRSGRKSSLVKKLLDPGVSQPSFNPAGASYNSLNRSIGKPADLPAMPSVWGLNATSPPAPAWAPQQPPWMSQPFAVPQRKF